MEAVLGDSSSGAKKTPAYAFPAPEVAFPATAVAFTASAAAPPDDAVALPAPEVKFPALLRGDAEESELSLSLERTRDAVS